MQVTVTFADFLTWITRNAFQECLLLNDDTQYALFLCERNCPLFMYVHCYFDSLEMVTSQGKNQGPMKSELF